MRLDFVFWFLSWTLIVCFLGFGIGFAQVKGGERIPTVLQSEKAEGIEELMDLARQRRLTVRALRGWGFLPKRFVDMGLELRKSEIDLLDVDIDRVCELARQASSDRPGPLLGYATELKALERYMTAFSALQLFTDTEIDRTEETARTSDSKLNKIKAEQIIIEKGEIPEIKFSSTDPCSPSNPEKDGLPWEASQENKIILPDGVDAVIPPAIKGLDKLSDLAYNSAVSSAFEAMRLVYGEISEKEAKLFQSAWAPLFDFPSQEVIDYLNRLNPIVSQFLICREAYARNMAAIQMLLLDAATAIEFDERQIWESAMAEARMYSSSLPPLENAMKQLMKKLENIGNPPNPVAAKCEARRRYNKMLNLPSGEYPFEGEWKDDTDKRYLLKVVHNFSDGKVLVYNFPVSWLKEMETKGFDINDSGLQKSENDSSLALMPGLYDLLHVFEELEPNVWVSLSYVLIPVVQVYHIENSRMITNKYTPPDYFQSSSKMQIINSMKVEKSYDPPPVLPIKGKQITWEEFLKIIPQNKWAGNKYAQYTRWRKNEKGEQQIAITVAGLQSREVTKPKSADNRKQKSTDPDQVGEEQSRREAIDFHNEMIAIIEYDLQRETKERNEVQKNFFAAKTEKETEEYRRRLKDLNFRIIGLQSNIQAEMDLVASYKTGEIVHTRTAFDNYAHQKLINGIKEEVANIEATQRVAERIERQIRLLPKEVQPQARKLAEQTLNGKTIASGNIEKAKQLTKAFGKQIEGYAGYNFAMAKEEEAYAEIKEQAAQAGIMVIGVGAVGFGSAALVEAYGAEAAAAIYGPKILGAIYGGTTGLVRGGPKEGVSGALMGWSPNGNALSQFIEGVRNAGSEEDANLSSQAWEGAKQAGYAWFTSKVFELGVTGVTKGLVAWRGSDSMLFKPIFQTSTPKTRQLQDVLRSKQQQLEAKDIVETFEKMEMNLAKLKLNKPTNVVEIQQMEDELQQLTASMNASYHAKWQFKYKASPKVRSAFDRRVQQNYAKMEPEMVKRMDKMGYKMDDIQFAQFRNANSAGSSSMDLDLVPVKAGVTGKQQKTIFMKKNGTTASVKEFMDDCQAAMNAEYRQLTGISAPASDMNLVTSAHKEAFATPRLLDKNIDMSQFTDEEIASIGKVLKVKMDGIDANKMFTNTYKMQAKAREAAKEIENMLLRKLKSNLNNAPARSVQLKEIQNQIKYWEKMLLRFKQIGMQEADPSKLIKLSNQIRRETGGKDIHAVINDIVTLF